MNSKKEYLPNSRTDYNPSEEELKSYSEDGPPAILPSPVLDPIVANNIAWQEGDYTEHLAESDKTPFKK